MFTRLLHVLWIVVLLPLASNAFAAGSHEGFALDPRVSLNAYAALVEQEFEGAGNGLRVLAASENAVSGDWNRIKGPLAIFAKGTPTSAAVWFARPDSSYFTVETGLTDQNLRNRDYFPALMAGKEVIGALVVSKSTGKRSAIIAVPVQDGERVIGALGVSIAMEKVAAVVEDKIAFPSEVIFYALDSHGQIALHREATLLFEFAAQLGSPTLAEAVKVMLSKPEGVVHYEFQSIQRTAIFKGSNATGWIYALRW